MNFQNNLIQLKRKIYRILYGSGATQILKSIEKIKGKTDSKLIRLSNQYAEDVLGSRKFANHLYIYCAITGTFKEGWIPESYYFEKVVPALKGDYGKLGELNGTQRIFFGDNSFPDVAYLINRSFLDTNYSLIKKDEFINYLFSFSDRVVFKKDNSARGTGIYILNRKNIDLNVLIKLGNGVFQKFINQHDLFNNFNDKAVATIRFTTAVDNDGLVSLRGCYLRVSRTNDSHVMSSSAIKIPIDLYTGRLNKSGYLPNWVEIDRHPDTGVLFSDMKIPFFQKSVDKCLELQKKLIYIKCIGWDVIIDNKNSPIVLEWNGFNNDIKFTEATQGPCFNDLGWENLWRTKI